MPKGFKRILFAWMVLVWIEIYRIAALMEMYPYKFFEPISPSEAIDKARELSSTDLPLDEIAHELSCLGVYEEIALEVARYALEESTNGFNPDSFSSIMNRVKILSYPGISLEEIKSILKELGVRHLNIEKGIQYVMIEAEVKREEKLNKVLKLFNLDGFL